MKLSEARLLFEKCQKRGFDGFIVRKHCWVDHPGRKFSKREILNLLTGTGVLKINKFPSAKKDSFLWCCKDRENKMVEIAVLFEKDQIIAIAISAFRGD